MSTWTDPRATPLDVQYDWHQRSWRVHGPEGDYGLVSSKDEAVAIALDAAVTVGCALGHDFRRIHVYDRDNLLLYTIINARREHFHATAQFFQDDAE